MREVKDIVSSLGSLAMWWVVGYSIQTAARLVVRDQGLGTATARVQPLSKAA